MPSPPGGAPLPVPAYEHTKTNGTSLFAFVSSLSSFICFPGVGGALGIVLGLIARNEIARSAGRETGRGLAVFAVAAGALNVGLAVIGLAVGITLLARPKSAVLHRAPTVTAPTWGVPLTPPRAPKASAKSPPPARASRELGSQVTRLGTLTLADISGDFAAELSKQRSAASAASETLVLWLVVPSCKPCDGVAAALTSPSAQKSLAKVRLVRADRDEFQLELERLGIPTEKIPGFALLDAHNHPLDFIHGGEWDADIAANIAPVLGKFVHGALSQRRHRWHGPAREDETQL